MVTAAPGGRTWRAARDITVEDRSGATVIRHRSLPDDGHLGVVVPASSWVTELVDYLRVEQSESELARRFPSTALANVLTRLRHNGIVFAGDVDEDVYVIQGSARSLARQAIRLAGAARVTGSGLRTELGDDTVRDLLTELNRMSVRLAEIASSVVDVQGVLTGGMAEKVVAGRTDVKLHLGCGGELMDSWVNVDLETGDVHADMRYGLPFPDACATYVYSAHVLEHFAYPDEALPLAREIHRTLRPGGVARILVPDIELCTRAYTDGDSDFFAQRAKYWVWAKECETPLEHFLAYAGANRSPFDMHGHKYGYDFETLAHLLRKAGFGTVVRSDYLTSEHEELRVDDRSIGARYTVDGRRLTLFVEATKE